MADHVAVFSVGPKTLDGTTIDTVTLTRNFRYVDVRNLDETGSGLYVTGASGIPPSDPVPGENDVLYVPPGERRTIEIIPTVTPLAAEVLKVRGDGNTYLVEGVTAAA